MGTKINTPLKRQTGADWRMLAKLWPWVLVVFFVGLFGQFVIGYFFNDFLMENAALFIPVMILGLLGICVLAGHGHDLQEYGRAEKSKKLRQRFPRKELEATSERIKGRKGKNMMTSGSEDTDSGWKSLYLIGGVCSLLMVAIISLRPVTVDLEYPCGPQALAIGQGASRKRQTINTEKRVQ